MAIIGNHGSGNRRAHQLAHQLDRHWMRWTLAAWIAIVAWYVAQRWGAITWLSLGDTDDNMRLMQVRAWMAGQGWYDLRDYRLNPPHGFDIHWSRIVDLPIAALIVILRPFAGPVWAEKLACGIAPLLPMSIALLGLGATVRRLVHPLSWPLAIVLFLGSTATLLMFMPERIDHHGWQLAMLSMTVAGLSDPRMRRGGALVGAASAVSLSIGLEMLPYAAMAGAIIALRWVWDRAEAPRLVMYGATLGGGCAIGYAAFGSYANMVLRCDALTPVWLSVMVAAGAFVVVLAAVSPRNRLVRLALAAAAGAVIVAGFALLFPQCLGRPEQVSPELAREWLNNVREAKPIYKHPFRSAFPIVALPVMGLIGAVVATWAARRDARIVGWVPVLLFSAFAALMLLWQARAGPAAQLLAVPGAVALAWIVFPWVQRSPIMLVRVLGSVVAFLAVSGLFAYYAIQWLPIDRPGPYVQRVNRATNRCQTLPSLRPLNQYPAQTIFTFTDLGPRLIVATHHSAIAGPYHRNGAAILDVQHAFKGSPDQARALMKAHGATLLLLCPNMAESTVYRAKAPNGFYGRMAKGERFDWLEPLPLPRGSPLRLFRVK